MKFYGIIKITVKHANNAIFQESYFDPKTKLCFLQTRIITLRAKANEVNKMYRKRTALKTENVKKDLTPSTSAIENLLESEKLLEKVT